MCEGIEGEEGFCGGPEAMGQGVLGVLREILDLKEGFWGLKAPGVPRS